MPSPSQPSRPVTLRQIAARAGVSHVTVSLALRGSPRIPVERRAAIITIAEEMGYRPDPMLHALNAYRRASASAPVTATLAWINRWPEPAQFRQHQEFAEYWQGAAAAADAHGFRLEEFREADGLAPARMAKVLLARGIQGIIIPPHLKGMDWSGFDFSPFAVVAVGYSQPVPVLYRVSSDQMAHAQLAWDSIAARGYRRIGFFGQPSATRRFLGGYLCAQQSVPASRRLPPLMLEPADSDAKVEALAAWAARHQPDAIISDHRNSLALCQSAGLRVPEDTGLAVLSVRDGGADAGIDQHPEEIGMVAVRVVVSLINRHQRGLPAVPHATLVSGTWVDGASLPQRAALDPICTSHVCGGRKS